jgi:hypothetical protein
VLVARAGNICHVASSLQAEMIAALRGVQQAARLGMQQIILETDASVLPSAISSAGIDQVLLVAWCTILGTLCDQNFCM